MRDSPYFQVGEWVELKLLNEYEYLNGIYQIKNVYLDNYLDNKDKVIRCFGYQLYGIDDKKFHGTCLLKLFDTATQTFDELMQDLLTRR